MDSKGYIFLYIISAIEQVCFPEDGWETDSSLVGARKCVAA